MLVTVTETAYETVARMEMARMGKRSLSGGVCIFIFYDSTFSSSYNWIIDIVIIDFKFVLFSIALFCSRCLEAGFVQNL